MVGKSKTLIGLGAVLIACSLGAVAWAMMAHPPNAQRARLPTVVESGAPPIGAPDSTPEPAALAPIAAPATQAPAPRRPVRRPPASRLSPVMQAALAAPDATKYFLADLSAIRDSAPGQAIINCLPERERQELSALKEKSGIDPINQAQRVGFADRLAVVEGDFAGVDWMQINPSFTHERRDGVDVYSNGVRQFAVIEDAQILMGEAEGIDAAIARIRSGQIEGAPAPLGDANGTLPLRALMDMLPMQPEVRDPLRAMFAEDDSMLKMRVDVSDRGADLQFNLDDLDPMLREGVKAGLEAAKGGGLRPDQRDNFAQLVDGIELDESDGNLRIRAPVSMEFLAGVLGECAQGK